jgi:hypothetical protein
MKRNILMLLLAGVFLIGIAAAPKLTTAWLNEDAKAEHERDKAEFLKRYGPNALHLIEYTPIFIGSGVGSNRIKAEIGFRSDGTVVWRKAE